MIFIPGNFPSFKNSKQRTKAGFMVMSATVQKYLKLYEEPWKVVPDEFLGLVDADYPIIVGMHFVRGTKHQWDFHNMVQGVADLMQKHGWIPNDCVNYLIPQCMMIDGEYWSYSKDNPGVYVSVLVTNKKK